MPTKHTKSYIIYNYRDDNLKMRKTKPSRNDISPYAVAMKLDLEVEVPEMEIPDIKQRVEIPEPEIRKAIGEIGLEELVENETFFEDLHPATVLEQEPEQIEAKLDELEEEITEEDEEEYEDFLFELLDYERKHYDKQEIKRNLKDRILDLRGGA